MFFMEIAHLFETNQRESTLLKLVHAVNAPHTKTQNDCILTGVGSTNCPYFLVDAL